MKLKVQAKYIPLLATALVMAALYIAGGAAYPRFFSLSVLVNLLGDNAFLGIAALGATFVILSKGIDLSVGAVIACISILVATLVERGMPPGAAISVALLAGTAFGGAMGCLIHYFVLPPFLVTLAGMFFARGIGFVIHPQSLGIQHEFFRDTVVRAWAIPLADRVFFPFYATCYLLLFLLALVLAHHTRFGRAVYALGGNEQSAQLMGLPVARTRIGVYALAGFCSAAAGVVYVFYMQSGNPAACVGLELDAIAAVVIGGTLLSGGVGYVGGTFMGVLILGLIQTLITFHGDLNTWWTRIVVGVLVLTFLLLQNVITAMVRRRSRQ